MVQGLDRWRWELSLDSQKSRTSSITGSHSLILSVCGFYGTTGLRSTGQGVRGEGWKPRKEFIG